MTIECCHHTGGGILQDLLQLSGIHNTPGVILIHALVRKQDGGQLGIGQIFLQPLQLFGMYIGQDLLVIVSSIKIVAVGVGKIFVTDLIVAAVQHNKVEAAHIKGIIGAVGHVVIRQRLLLRAHIALVVTQHMIGGFLKIVEHVDNCIFVCISLGTQSKINIYRTVLGLADAFPVFIRIAEVTQLDNEIHIFLPAIFQKFFQPLLGIVHDVHMQIGKYAEFDLFLHKTAS